MRILYDNTSMWSGAVINRQQLGSSLMTVFAQVGGIAGLASGHKDWQKQLHSELPQTAMMAVLRHIRAPSGVKFK